jgi:hypothetical protein
MATRKQKKMKSAVAYLQDYMNTYTNQTGYQDYSEETLINDVLYGLGVAIGGKENMYGNGYVKFKDRLRDIIR